MAPVLTLVACGIGVFWAVRANADAEGLEGVITGPILAAVVVTTIGILIGMSLANNGSSRAVTFLKVILALTAVGAALVALIPPWTHALPELGFAAVAAAASALYPRRNPQPS